MKQLLDDIHNSGMHAILGIVPRYTSRDNPLITSNPEYYVHRDDGTITYPASFRDVLHKNFPAIYKGNFYKLRTNMDNNIFAFMRESGDEQLLVVANLSGENKNVQIESEIPKQRWKEYFTGEKTRSFNDIELSPYGYKVYISQ